MRKVQLKTDSKTLATIKPVIFKVEREEKKELFVKRDKEFYHYLTQKL